MFRATSAKVHGMYAFSTSPFASSDECIIAQTVTQQKLREDIRQGNVQ